MKKAAFITGTLPIIVLATGALFKMHHWDGAGLFILCTILPAFKLYQVEQ